MTKTKNKTENLRSSREWPTDKKWETDTKSLTWICPQLFLFELFCWYDLCIIFNMDRPKYIFDLDRPKLIHLDAEVEKCFKTTFFF